MSFPFNRLQMSLQSLLRQQPAEQSLWLTLRPSGPQQWQSKSLRSSLLAILIKHLDQHSYTCHLAWLEISCLIVPWSPPVRNCIHHVSPLIYSGCSFNFFSKNVSRTTESMHKHTHCYTIRPVFPVLRWPFLIFPLIYFLSFNLLSIFFTFSLLQSVCHSFPAI